MKIFTLLFNAICDKKQEIGYSFLLLVLLTLPCSCLLFHFESDYDFSQAISWSFLQYIDNTGGLVQPPVTYAGGVIACVLTILKYAFFVVFISIFGKGFIKQIQKEQDKENINKLENCFRWTQDKVTKYIVPPRYISLATIQVKCQLDTKKIWDAVNASYEDPSIHRHYRIGNLARVQSTSDKPFDRLVVECYPKNTDYGCYINRKSNVTIVGTSNNSEVGIGNLAFFLAKFGGFNYVSKEVEQDMSNPISYYNVPKKDELDKNDASYKNLNQFLKDIRNLSGNINENWIIFILSSTGRNKEKYKTQIHYIHGTKKNGTIIDSSIQATKQGTFDDLYEDLSQEIEKEFKLSSDVGKAYVSENYKEKNIAYHLRESANAFTIRFDYEVVYSDTRFLSIVESMARIIQKHLSNKKTFIKSLPKKFEPKHKRSSGYNYDEIKKYR